MLFDLSPEIVDQIIFGMENQEHDYYVDAGSGLMVPEHDLADYEDGESDRVWVPIPEWRSVHGFNLMERFIADLRNPLFRERLRGILNSGRGIFRQFKDALKERPEIERLWYRFKEREMRREVFEWYNDLREQWGLASLPVDLETETDELILADFTFREDGADAAEIDALSDLALSDALSEFDETEQIIIEDAMLLPDDGVQRSVTAFTAGGERVGIAACRTTSGEHTRQDPTAVVEVLYVVPEYRGLGLGKELLSRLCTMLHRDGVGRIHVDVPGSAAVITRLLKHWGGSTITERIRLDLSRWDS
ncbi:MAG: GNAT family N-acetyltransferase [Spirochaetaceae bacterium]